MSRAKKKKREPKFWLEPIELDIVTAHLPKMRRRPDGSYEVLKKRKSRV